MSAALPIAVGSIFTECNHLGGKPTESTEVHFAYDPAVTGIERSRYDAFVGCFPYHP